MSLSSPLRVGLLLDDVQVTAYTQDFIDRCKQHPEILLSHLVLHPVRATTPSNRSRLGRVTDVVRKRGMVTLIDKIVFHLLLTAERTILRRVGFRLGESERFDLTSSGIEQIVVVPQVSPSGFVYRFGDKDLERLRACNFDVLIRLGNGILRGELLKLPRFGVLSFHHGDNRVNRGGPPGYWEVHGCHDSTGFIIQRLTEELDGGEVLFRGCVQTRPPFLRNNDLLMRESTSSLVRLLVDLARNRQMPPARDDVPYTHRLLRSPTVLESAQYLKRQVGLWGGKVVRRLAGRRTRWGVAIQSSHWRKAVFWRATFLPNPPGHFLADPFVVTRNDRTVVFVEDYSQSTSKANIVAYELTATDPGGPANTRRLGIALEEPFHLSFPYLFTYDGELYMCPETQQQREVRIYRCLDFPLRWELATIVMRDVDMVDTMLFEHDGRWWMLTNMVPGGATGSLNDCYAELHAFHADSPFATSWTPHPLNPLIVDSERARNGGLLYDKGQLFRVAQRYGYDRYGAGATVFRIDELSTTVWRETPITTLTPDFHKGLTGTHHLHSNGQWTVLDYSRYERL